MCRIFLVVVSLWGITGCLAGTASKQPAVRPSTPEIKTCKVPSKAVNKTSPSTTAQGIDEATCPVDEKLAEP